MPNCPVCGIDVPAGTQYCPACGTNLEQKFGATMIFAALFRQMRCDFRGILAEAFRADDLFQWLKDTF